MEWSPGCCNIFFCDMSITEWNLLVFLVALFYDMRVKRGVHKVTSVCQMFGWWGARICHSQSYYVTHSKWIQKQIIMNKPVYTEGSNLLTCLFYLWRSGDSCLLFRKWAGDIIRCYYHLPGFSVEFLRHGEIGIGMFFTAVNLFVRQRK